MVVPPLHRIVRQIRMTPLSLSKTVCSPSLRQNQRIASSMFMPTDPFLIRSQSLPAPAYQRPFLFSSQRPGNHCRTRCSGSGCRLHTDPYKWCRGHRTSKVAVLVALALIQLYAKDGEERTRGMKSLKTSFK
jgi:hypothetical protein